MFCPFVAAVDFSVLSKSCSEDGRSTSSYSYSESVVSRELQSNSSSQVSSIFSVKKQTKQSLDQNIIIENQMKNRNI